MTHILLPFMILPLYSVMKTIPPSYARAAPHGPRENCLGRLDITSMTLDETIRKNF
jgi:hypothetical protein